MIRQTGMRFMVLVGCVLLGSAALSGCGKKGPLYLPDEVSAPKQDSNQTPSSAAPKPEK